MQMNRPQDFTSQSTPFMDKMTHSIVVETSAKLNQYIKIKRRENGFILNPSSTAVDTVPLRARFIYGTSKQYPPLYSSAYTDNDVKTYLRAIGNIDPERFSTDNQLEKRMCHDELRYHMRARQPISVGNQAFAKLQLGSTRRSQSSFSGFYGRDSSRDLQHSANQNNKLLVEDTANILAEFTKARQKITLMSSLSRQATPTIDSRNPYPTPRQDDSSPKATDSRPSATQSPKPPSDRPHKPSPRSDRSHNKKETVKDPYTRALSKMKKSKLITKGILCTYKIMIKTGNVNGASTDATISMVLYGEKGHTKPFKLIDSETHEVPFQKNQTDNFTVEIDHVGKLIGIQIGHDEESLQAGWYLSTVTIEDTLRSRIFEIPCNAWLSSSSEDKKTKRDFIIVSKSKGDSNDHVHSDDSTNRSGYSSTITDRSNTSKMSTASRKSGSSVVRQKKTNQKRRESSSNTIKVKHGDSVSITVMPIATIPTNQKLASRELSTPTEHDEDRSFSPIIKRTPPKESENEPTHDKNQRNDYETSTESISVNRNKSTILARMQQDDIYYSNNQPETSVSSHKDKKESSPTMKVDGYDFNAFDDDDDDYNTSTLQESNRFFDSKTATKKSAQNSDYDFFD